MAFWGNPITSASRHMDYFISGDHLEHPFRTRIPLMDEPYSEQVILIAGQGIWYFTPESPSTTIARTMVDLPLSPPQQYTRQEFQLLETDFVYLCPQSVFKMHPLYDQILANILLRNPRGHVVVTGGRKLRWSAVYLHRLLYTLHNVNPSLHLRLHIINRVSSEKFLGLLTIADVILHPFPFDGSRTSADGLIAGKPVLTLPSEYLRGRMGVAFLSTMNIPELVA